MTLAILNERKPNARRISTYWKQLMYPQAVRRATLAGTPFRFAKPGETVGENHLNQALMYLADDPDDPLLVEVIQYESTDGWMDVSALFS